MTKHSFEIESERLQFKQLLAVNPNYFGNLPVGDLVPVSGIACNTKYEELCCLAYNPDLDLLEALVEIKLPVGYNGKLCGEGSREYVRFFVNYGCGWKDAGVASFKVHDLASVPGREFANCLPLCYAVSLEHQPVRDRCNRPVIPTVRAVLSWEVMPPDDAEWLPVWGNVVENRVQVTPRARKLIELACDIAKVLDPEAELPDEFDYLKDVSVNLPSPPPRRIETLVKLYGPETGHFSVDPHRFAMPDVQAALAGSFLTDSAAVDTKLKQYRTLGLDWQHIAVQLEKTEGNVDYEALSCVGFDYNREWAVANITVKRPAGYQGTLCEHGSDEHVAFWVDWEGNGEWHYLTTVAVRVHDIGEIPADGLNYWVGAPLQLGERRRYTKLSKVAKLRAVLSWHQSPSTADPDALPVWGNRMDAHFEIKPGITVTEMPAIDAIGGIGVGQIDVGGDGLTVPNAYFAATGAPADGRMAMRRCAFGGDVYINAEVPISFSTKAYKYRLLVRPADSGGCGEPLMASFVATRSPALGGGTVWISPELGSGWVNYLRPDCNIYSVLGNWRTAELGSDERNGLWEIKLELADASSKLLGHSGWLRIRLDNRTPLAKIGIGASAEGWDCSEFVQGDTVAGRFVADAWETGRFGGWTLDVLTNSHVPHALALVPLLSNSSPTGPDPGYGWRLDTAAGAAGNTLRPCVCVLRLKVWDNTIVHSSQFVHNYAEDDASFCLRAEI